MPQEEAYLMDWDPIQINISNHNVQGLEQQRKLLIKFYMFKYN